MPGIPAFIMHHLLVYGLQHNINYAAEGPDYRCKKR